MAGLVLRAARLMRGGELRKKKKCDDAFAIRGKVLTRGCHTMSCCCCVKGPNNQAQGSLAKRKKPSALIFDFYVMLGFFLAAAASLTVAQRLCRAACRSYTGFLITTQRGADWLWAPGFHEIDLKLLSFGGWQDGWVGLLNLSLGNPAALQSC